MTENDNPVQSEESASESAEEKNDSGFERRWSKKSTARPLTPVEPASAAEEGDGRKRADELFDQLQRARADLSNYRKRMEAEREEMAKMASMLLVADLLPVLDNFERALETIPQELQYFTWLQGIALIERHLQSILERQGVQQIEAVGQPFNPSLHEAIVEEESADAAPGTVIGELQKGYTMHGHVIRPTLAKIAKAASTSSTPDSDTIESAPE